MDTFEFSGTVLVEAQGPRVMTLVARHPDHAEYEVIGFHGTVVIRDFRRAALASLDLYAAGDKATDFAGTFSQLAAAEMLVCHDRIHVDLYEPTHEVPSHMLWIAVGLESELPVLDYIVVKFERYQDDALAIVALTQFGEVDVELQLPLLSATAAHSSSSADGALSLPFGWM